ncbi:hypothetical protein GVN24_33175 [Rhizobium sp. CRIBSB]|nr:hypothetical protein [Rhizobium sp. CRIBSB]
MRLFTRLLPALVVAVGLVGCAIPAMGQPAPAAWRARPLPAGNAACPEALPKDTRCYSGRSEAGAFYWIAIPADWHGGLVLHAHGGPRRPPPEANDPVDDLTRFSVMVSEGYAWAGSTYRRGGYGVRMAAEDMDQLRQIFWTRFGRPRITLLHGQSWGGNVAAKAQELYAFDADGGRNYDGVFLSAGVLGGGSRAYGFRADLRAVYQFYCKNHPAPDEAQYALWSGLPRGVTMRRVELERRVEACTGVSLSDAQRTPAQRRALANITAVVGIEADELTAHLWWATNLFQDLVGERLDGGNPFSNRATVYAGSDDDAALNAGVERFEADPMAVARLAWDSDLSGQIALPTLTVHAIHDPTVFVSHEAMYRQTVADAGRANLLVQTFTDEDEHSKLSTPQYAALLAALADWIETGQRPTPQGIADACPAFATLYSEPCRFVPDFVPQLPEG